MTTVRIVGNTFRCKDLIKGEGGKFDAISKSWVISADAWEILSALDGGHATAGCRVAGAEQVPMTLDQAIEAAVARRAADQPAQTVPVRAYRPVTNKPCRRCGTYCYGDCTA